MNESLGKELDGLWDRLQAIQKEKVTAGGRVGYFLSQESLDGLEKVLQDIDEEADGSFTDRIKQFNAEIKKLREGQAVTEAVIREKEVTVKQLRHQHDALQKETLDIVRASMESKKSIKATIDKIAADMKIATALNQENKARANKAKKGFDSDEAVAAHEAHQRSAAEVSRLNKELEQANGQVRALNVEVDKQRKRAATLTASLSESASELTSLKSKQALINNDLSFDPRPVVIEITNPWLRAAIGDKGLKWFKEAAQLQEHEVRERLFKTIQALNSAKKSDRRLTNLRDLVQVAFDWVKSKAYKVRLEILPWLNGLQADIAAGTLRGLTYYREQLEIIVGKLKGKAKEIKDKVEEYIEDAKPKAKWGFFAFFEEINDWRRVLWHRSKRATKRVGSFFIRVPVTLYSKVKSWFAVNDYCQPGSCPEQCRKHAFLSDGEANIFYNQGVAPTDLHAH